MRHVRDIHRRFGTRPLETLPTCDIFKYRLYYRWMKGIRVTKLLDYVPYIKTDVIKLLTERLQWRPYPQKHYESRFTRFYESFWTPNKFGYDKRRAYLSSEVLTGQISRDAALERIARPELDDETMAREFEYVATKLGWTVQEFEAIYRGENKRYQDYANNEFLITAATRVFNRLGLDNRIFR
jgi:hypothetical protein